MALAQRQDGSGSENKRTAFEMADAWAKQIATLATGALVLSATFIKDILPKDEKVDGELFIYFAWALLLVSAVLGLVVLGALTSHLSRNDGKLDVYAPSIRLSALAQFASFIVGLGLFALFAGLNLN